MKLLLDTHVFIWLDSEPGNLSPTAAALLGDPDNLLLLSVASLWEMQIKQQLGKLTLRMPLPNTVAQQVATNSLVILPIMPAHVYGVGTLPTIHNDPFDRLLVAQALAEDAVLVTGDAALGQYPVRVLW